MFSSIRKRGFIYLLESLPQPARDEMPAVGDPDEGDVEYGVRASVIRYFCDLSLERIYGRKPHIFCNFTKNIISRHKIPTSL